MTKINIGKHEDGSPAVTDLDKLISTRMLIQANSGGGKSWTGRKILEESHGKVQQIVIDLEGEFYTLTERYDYVVVGGDNPHVPLEIKTAKILANRLLESGVSAIFDLSECIPSMRQAYVRTLVSALLDAPKKLRHPVIVYIDEIHQFAPENGKAESRMAIERLASSGRKRGLCLIGASQRTAKLAKDVAAELLNVLAGRTSLDNDVKRVSDMLGFTEKEKQRSLRQLSPGQFFAFGPAISQEVVSIKVGKVKTTHPEPNKRYQVSAPKITEKLKKTLSKLGDLVKDAQEDESTTDGLRRLVASLRTDKTRLERAQKTQKVAAPSKEDMTRVAQKGREAGFKEGVIASWKAWADFLSERREDAMKAAHALKGGPDKPTMASCGMAGPVEPTKWDTVQKIVTERGRDILPSPNAKVIDEAILIHKRNRSATETTYYPSSPFDRGDEASFGKGPMTILRTIVAFDPRRITQAQLSTFSGYSAKGSTFRTYVAALRAQGFIRSSNREYWATEEGIAMAGHVDPMPTDTETVINKWSSRLGNGPSSMLRYIVRAYPDAVSYDGIANATGYSTSGSTFRTYIAKLRSNDLVVNVDSGVVKANPELFPEIKE